MVRELVRGKSARLSPVIFWDILKYDHCRVRGRFDYPYNRVRDRFRKLPFLLDWSRPHRNSYDRHSLTLLRLSPNTASHLFLTIEPGLAKPGIQVQHPPSILQCHCRRFIGCPEFSYSRDESSVFQKHLCHSAFRETVVFPSVQCRYEKVESLISPSLEDIRTSPKKGLRNFYLLILL